ncbi:Fatty acid cis/trans isomerase (CTI) [Albimonas donghaensis]|uniref:Fatty acid cis/trans isomerase (CTI) n=1 Tax=Albimonas donghaensis TaxID=356660 RepID=A0A1H3DIA6_9RHOB|nr:fatty acid cis/trans isomerase [Albimonas donghaensis]SDX66203.1 Fatty acid cis/trans isomerase (CTI) [Albimonas donghaensis]
MRILLALSTLALVACSPDGGLRLPASDPPPPPPDLAAMLPAEAMSRPDPQTVQRIVDRRCVVCHGCYDAPCQLKLASAEGLVRGASSEDVYDTERLRDAPPTRLGVDATDEAGWRALGFHSVLARAEAGDPASSLMARMLALGRARPFAMNAPLPDTAEIGRDRAQVCPTPETFARYAEDRPWAGMPFATAPLPEDEFAALGAWSLAGDPLPPRAGAVPPAAAARRIADWETFLNAPDPRARLVARYVFEHLFLAHLHLEGDAPDRFFRLIRSSTPPGEPPRPIATRRPYDDPGPAFFYRIVPIAEAITHKDHLVYEIGPGRMDRLRALFLAPDWQAGPAPGWGAKAGGAPFVTFAAIPAEARYRFLLDDALFFVRSFIRGPVCRGQVATDVIEDRFWVTFLAPEADLSVADPGFLAEGAPLLTVPAAANDAPNFLRLQPLLLNGHAEWLAFRDARYEASPAHAGGFGLGDIWDGAGAGGRDGPPTERLTVFRNHDNASVLPGFVGTPPETAWVLDYPTFERIVYDLVTGYDVFGSVETQLTTRLYMDHLRREAENLFLAFMPADARRGIHAEWYRGPLSDLHASGRERRPAERLPTAVRYATDAPKDELLARIEARGETRGEARDEAGAPAARRGDPLNRCQGAACAGLPEVERALARIAGEGGDWVRWLPDLSVLRVTGAPSAPGAPDAPDGARVFTLFHDKAHTNVGLMLAETLRREPERDRLTIIAGQVGSYPNLFFEVDAADLGGFVAELSAMRSEADWLEVVARHGVRRMSERFWAVADALTDDMLRRDPLQAGLLDLNRYLDPKPAALID